MNQSHPLSNPISNFLIADVYPPLYVYPLQYYNKWLSFMTFLLCIAVMFWIGWQIALGTCAIVAFFYFFVVYREPGK